MVRTTIRMLSIAVPSTEPRSLADFLKVLERGEKLEKEFFNFISNQKGNMENVNKLDIFLEM